MPVPMPKRRNFPDSASDSALASDLAPCPPDTFDDPRPRRFDYDEFSKFIVESNPGTLEPRRALAEGENFLDLKTRPRKRETVAWGLVLAQVVIMAAIVLRNDGGTPGAFATLNAATATAMNGRPMSYYDQRRVEGNADPSNLQAYYETPSLHVGDGGAFVERKWHSNGALGDLKEGSCWCSADNYCLCTPSLAIDAVLLSGSDHVWLVRRSDTGQLALMGGFNEVGETSLETLHRELAEEMSIVLPPDSEPKLFGVYNDPMRDSRRHTSSVVYVVEVPGDVRPEAGDDAAEVLLLPLADVEKEDFFVDHKQILLDYIQATSTNNPPVSGNGGLFRRSICPMA